MEMYNNVINNHDVVLMEKFLREFCTPTCRYLVTVSRPSRPVVNIVDRVGIPDILLGQVQFYIKLPDSIYQMGDAQIHVTYQQPGSYIVSAVKLQGTRLFEMENDAITLLNSTFQNTSSYSTSSHQSTENKSSDDATESSDESDVLSISFSQSAPLTEMRYNDVIDALALLPPSSFDLDAQNDGLIVSEIMPRLQSMRLLQLPSPRDVTAHGLLTMDLDPNHRIETLRFDVHLLRETDHKFTWSLHCYLPFFLIPHDISLLLLLFDEVVKETIRDSV